MVQLRMRPSEQGSTTSAGSADLKVAINAVYSASVMVPDVTAALLTTWLVDALGKLEAAVLAQYAPALVAKLEHSDGGVRQAAVVALGKLEAAVLAQHAPGLVAKLEDSDRGVRRAAVDALGKACKGRCSGSQRRN